MRIVLVAAAASVLVLTPLSQAADSLTFRTLDGSGNNTAHPEWGKSGRPYLRVATARYGDGVKTLVAGPNARRISNRIFNDRSQNVFSERNLSQWAWLWGQFLDHTFGLRDETPGESAPIAFDATDPLEDFTNDFGAIDFSRTVAAPGTGTGTVPRDQINTVTSYIDAFAVYGGTETRLDWLRRGPANGNTDDNKAGLLLPGNYLPRADARGDTGSAPQMDLMGRLQGDPPSAVVAGDVRANENIGLTGVHTLFAREHDRIVAALPRELSEQDKFKIARRVVGAEEQYVTYHDFLPAMGVDLAPYHGYDPSVDATLSNEFATVGYRAHSQIHGEMEPTVREGRYGEAQLDAFEAQGIEIERDTTAHTVTLVIPLNLAFGNPHLLEQIGVGPLLKGLAAERQYRNDEQIDNQLRSVLFQVPKAGVDPSTCLDGPPLPDCFNGVVDLGAIDVKRGRDHGMPSYNGMRQAYGLPPKTSFAAITGESTESFPNDPLLTAPKVDDPNSLDFVELKDANGQAVDPEDDEALGNDVVTAVRRTTVAARLKAIYGTVDKVEAFVGMVAEPHVAGSELGELQLAMWKKQFEALRDGDRFFYGNDAYLDTIRTQYGIDYRQSLARLIEANTDAHVQPDVFVTGSVPEPAGQLVAAYSFDAGSGPSVADLSGLGNTGSIANATWAAAGHSGSALSFNGTNAWVTVADAPSLDLRGAMTVEAWVKPTRVGAWATAVIKEAAPDELSYGLYASSDSGQASAHVQVDPTTPDTYVRGAPSLPANVWTHIAATYDGATVRVYVNGALQGSTPMSGPIQTSGGALRIGGNAVWSEWFAGLIDDVRVYSRALSDAEVQADMATPTATPPRQAGLVAAYAFDAGAGSSALDASGKGNTGTLANATWTTAGHSGAALSFNGSNAWVTVPDSASLDLTAAMTLEAWVRPTQVGTWETVVLKEAAGELVYGLYASTDTAQPSGHVFPVGQRADLPVRGSPTTPANAWTHLAVTYDGAALRVYVNGVQQGARAVTGAIQTSGGPLRIGGNAVWSEWFAGVIDDVRVYNRALTATELQADMATAVT
jgi:hypothetical protein